MNTLYAIPLALALGACSKQDAAPDKKDQSKSVETAAKPAAAGLPSGELSDFDLAGIAKKFDGKTFVIPTSLGKQVWSFAGGKVTIVDGGKQETGDLEVSAPCALKVRMPEKNGTYDVKEQSFAWDGDKLYMGSGHGGLKHGDVYAACYGVDTFIMKGNACKLGMPGAWAAATCRVEGNSLVTESITYEIVGNVLLDKSLKGSVAELVPDLAAGKAKL